MLGLIFSYAKSMAVFLVMTALCVFCGVLTGIYTAEPLTIALRIVAIAVIFVLSFLVSFILAARTLQSRIMRIGGEQCRLAELSAHLGKMRKRCLAAIGKAPVQLEYAATLIDMGEYKAAELMISDALAMNLTAQAKSYAHLLYAYLTFVRPDYDRFRHYYDDAKRWLNESLQAKGTTPREIARDTVRQYALDAMQAALLSDSAAAQTSVRAATLVAGILPLQALTVRALGIEIARRAQQAPDETYLEYLRANGTAAGYAEYYRYQTADAPASPQLDAVPAARL